MEPTDLKNDSPESVQLETWLRSEAAATPLPDDGFSRRVLAALPARTPRLSRQRLWFCLGGALLGVIVTLVGLQRPGSLAVDLPALGPVFTQAISQLAATLFKKGAAERVIVAAMPKIRAAMHLDTVFTFADRDCVLLAPDFLAQTRTFSYRPSSHPSGVELHKEEKPFVDVGTAVPA